MADEFERRMAKRALMLLKEVKPTPRSNHVAQAARKILTGNNSAQDVSTVRAFTGDHRGGASTLKSVGQSVRRGVDRVRRVGEDIGQLSEATKRGSGSADALSNLVSDAEKNVSDVLRSKPVRSLAKAVTKMIADDASLGGRILKSLGRSVRLGSEIGRDLLVGIGIAEELVSGQSKLAKSRSRVLDTSRQFNSNAEIGREIYRRAAENARNQAFFSTKQGVVKKFGPDIVKEYLESLSAADAEGRHREEIQARMAARGALGEFGIDANAALGVMARQHGIAPELLTDRERNEAIDTPLDTFIQGQENSGDATDYAVSQLRILRGSGFFASGEYMNLKASGGLEAKAQEFKHEFALRQTRTQAARVAENQKIGDAFIQSLTPQQRYAKWEREQRSQAEAVSYRTRHQLAEVD